MDGITLVTNPLVNSYKRLVPGYDAPVDIAWSGSSANRSALIRIPSQKGAETQIEIRNPDATCNPYLALALCLAAGMDGIRRKLTPPEELHASVNADADNDMNPDRLPETLGEAIEAYSKDEFVKSVLGDQIYRKFLTAKKKEWREFRMCVTQWELKEYLDQY